MKKYLFDEEWIRANNATMTNRQMAAHFGCGVSTIAWMRNKMGLGKMELEMWTPAQVKWLKQLYTIMGDYELALVFQEAYPKNKEWTKKHIEKKRNYLGLHRTAEQLLAIKKRNYAFGSNGANLKRIHTSRLAPLGTVRVWEGREFVRTEKGNEVYARWLWSQAYGEPAAGMNVVKKNPLQPTTLENLECISNAELACRNSFHRYPLELKRTIIALNRFKKSIYEKQDNRLAHTSI